jgi:MFS transporter, OFA family, oxalate/formate antiporter
MGNSKKHLSYTFYRITIALAVFLAFFLQTFLLVDGTNIFMAHFTSWSSTQVSLPITIGGYIAIVTTFLIGSWLIRHKGRGMMFALIAISGLATIAMAYSENCYPLYFVSLVINNITLGALLVLMTAIITNWFNSTRGRMLGFVTIGAPFSTAACVPIIQRLLEAGVAFQTIFLVFGLGIIVFGILAFLLVPYLPEDVGYHADNKDHAAVQTDTGATQKWTFAKLVRCKEAWFIMLAFGLMMLVSNCVMPLLFPHFLEVGVSSEIVLNLMTISAIVGIPLSYLWGWLDDKIGTKKSCYTLAIGFTLMSIGMAFATSGNMIVVAMAVIGIAAVVGGSPNLNPSIIVNVFGASEYLNVNRYLNIGQNILRLLALVMMSAIKDLTGSYTPGYVVCIVLSLVALLCFIGIRQRYTDAAN